MWLASLHRASLCAVSASPPQLAVVTRLSEAPAQLLCSCLTQPAHHVPTLRPPEPGPPTKGAHRHSVLCPMGVVPTGEGIPRLPTPPVLSSFPHAGMGQPWGFLPGGRAAVPGRGREGGPGGGHGQCPLPTSRSAPWPGRWQPPRRSWWPPAARPAPARGAHRWWYRPACTRLSSAEPGAAPSAATTCLCPGERGTGGDSREAHSHCVACSACHPRS